MDSLLKPELGLAIWTIVSFAILVVLLRGVAWNPLLAALDAREARLRAEREGAEKARGEAERIQKELERRLSQSEAEAKDILARAGKDGEALRASLKDDAQRQAKELLERTRVQLAEDKRRLVGELRGEVAALSVMAAERLVKKSVDGAVQKSVLEQFFGELDGPRAGGAKSG